MHCSAFHCNGRSSVHWLWFDQERQPIRDICVCFFFHSNVYSHLDHFIYIVARIIIPINIVVILILCVVMNITTSGSQRTVKLESLDIGRWSLQWHWDLYVSVFLCFYFYVFLCFCVSVFLCFCVSVFLCFCVSVFLAQHAVTSLMGDGHDPCQWPAHWLAGWWVSGYLVSPISRLDLGRHWCS